MSHVHLCDTLTFRSNQTQEGNKYLKEDFENQSLKDFWFRECHSEFLEKKKKKVITPPVYWNIIYSYFFRKLVTQISRRCYSIYKISTYERIYHDCGKPLSISCLKVSRRNYKSSL